MNHYSDPPEPVGLRLQVAHWLVFGVCVRLGWGAAEWAIGHASKWTP